MINTNNSVKSVLAYIWHMKADGETEYLLTEEETEAMCENIARGDIRCLNTLYPYLVSNDKGVGRA